MGRGPEWRRGVEGRGAVAFRPQPKHEGSALRHEGRVPAMDRNGRRSDPPG